MKLTNREIATVLHALRIYQAIKTTDGIMEEADACDHFEDYDPLTDAEVDELCERFNMDWEGEGK